MISFPISLSHTHFVNIMQRHENQVQHFYLMRQGILKILKIISYCKINIDLERVTKNKNIFERSRYIQGLVSSSYD